MTDTPQPPSEPDRPSEPAGGTPPPPPPQGGGYGAPPPPPPQGGGYGTPPPPPPQGGGYGYGGPPGPGPAGQLSQQDERTWAMFAHIGALIASVVALSFLGPLLVMLVQGPKSAFVRRHAVEALNFQITTYIAGLVSFILVFVIIGFVLLPVVVIGWLVLTIIAGIAANRGEDYRYPINLRLVK